MLLLKMFFFTVSLNLVECAASGAMLQLDFNDLKKATQTIQASVESVYPQLRKVDVAFQDAAEVLSSLLDECGERLRSQKKTNKELHPEVRLNAKKNFWLDRYTEFWYCEIISRLFLSYTGQHCSTAGSVEKDLFFEKCKVESAFEEKRFLPTPAAQLLLHTTDKHCHLLWDVYAKFLMLCQHYDCVDVRMEHAVLKQDSRWSAQLKGLCSKKFAYSSDASCPKIFAKLGGCISLELPFIEQKPIDARGGGLSRICADSRPGSCMNEFYKEMISVSSGQEDYRKKNPLYGIKSADSYQEEDEDCDGDSEHSSASSTSTARFTQEDACDSKFGVKKMDGVTFYNKVRVFVREESMAQVADMWAHWVPMTLKNGHLMIPSGRIKSPKGCIHSYEWGSHDCGFERLSDSAATR